MIVDARVLVPGSVVVGDVCVVGAGPVGVAVAEYLESVGLDVVQLESGGREHDAAADALGEAASLRFGTVPRLGNTRRLGGNANAWQVRTGVTHRGVRLLPLSPVDLEVPPVGDGAPWPIPFEQLELWVARAQDFFGLPALGYDGGAWLPAGETVPADPEVHARVFQFANAGALLERWVERMERSPSRRVLTHATAAEVLTDGRTTTGVRVATAPGRELVVRARAVVLAAGAISTTQLLLASGDGGRGLGAGSGALGRHLMDHPLLQGGELWPSSPDDVRRLTQLDLRVVDGVPVMGHLQLTDEAVAAERLLNLSMLLYPRERGYARRRALTPRQLAGVHAALAVREAALRRHLPRHGTVPALVAGLDGVLRRAIATARHPEPSLGRGGWSTDRGRRWVCFEVIHQAEQAPHADNRIRLGQQRDALGMPRVEVEWRWHDEDVAATRRAQEVFARAVARMGWGEFRIAEVDGAPVVRSSSSNHFMGTTRMSADPRHGVVDPRGALHEVPNLYVASSSVFPTGGFANVTLTAVALGLRTAEAVAADLGPVRTEHVTTAATPEEPVAPDDRTGLDAT